MRTCDGYCADCDCVGYYNNTGHVNANHRICEYLVRTGHRRGCPAGIGCERKRVGGEPVPHGFPERMAQEARTAGRKEGAR